MKKFLLTFLMAFLAIPAFAQDVVYKAITSQDEIQDQGVYLIVCPSKNVVMGAQSGKFRSPVNATITNGEIKGLPDEAVECTLIAATDGYMIKTNENQYLKWTSDNAVHSDESELNASVWSLTFSNNIAAITEKTNSNGARHLKYNSTSPRFACYTGGQTDITLYKKVVSTPPAEPQTYTAPFDGKTFNLKVGAGTEQLEFGPSHPEISYEYNPTGIVTVDENGIITPEAEGTATVTASWVANDYWNAGTATFTAIVAKADPISEYTDLMTPESFNMEGNSYSNYSYTSTTTNVEYAIKGSKNSGIQINTSGSGNAKNSGIISTKNTNNLNIEKIEIISDNPSRLKVSVANTPGTITGTGTSTVISEPKNPTPLTGKETDSKTFIFTPTENYQFFYIASSGVVKISNLNIYYKMPADPTKEDAGLAYAETDITKYTTDGAFTNPLTNPNNLAVSYTSSNPEVATVDENTGEVTIVTKGTTRITATSAETDTYNKGIATYTLTVARLYNNLAEIIGENGAQDGESVKINFPLTVGYHSNNQVYVTDGEDWIQIYNNGTWNADYQPKDIIPAGWSATFELHNSGTSYNDQIPRLTNPNGYEKGDTQGEFTIETVKSADITKAMINKIVKIENVAFETALPASNKTVKAEDFTYWNNGHITNLNSNPAGIYTVTGIITSYHNTLELEMTQVDPFAPEIKIDGSILEGNKYAPSFHHKDKHTIVFPTIEGIMFYYKITQAGTTEAPALAAQEGYTEYTAPFEISGIGTLSYYAEKGSYQTTPTDIEFDIQTGVNEIEIDMTAADAEIFDMTGCRVSADRLAKGIYLVRQNGKTAKVYVK